MPQSKRPSETTYYDSDDEPCRVHRDEDGDLTGDAYRRGRGIVSISPSDIIENGYTIGRARYEELVRDRGGIFEDSDSIPRVSK
jgi:hypothetical protein